LIPIQFPPGVTNLASKNAKIMNWREAHLIRWDNGITLRPVGGWEKTTSGPFASKLRKMHRWAATDRVLWTAYLCEQHCYVENASGFQDITPVGGLTPPAPNQAGYGNDVYSLDQYGTPRPGLSHLLYYSPMFSLGNWGQELRVMTSADGRYLGWSPSAVPGTKLTPVAGAPANNRSFIITPERHAMLFGMNAEDKFGWSDEEDDTNWDFAGLTSRARFYDIYPKSAIITQQLFDGGIVFFTNQMSYLVEWSGLPYVYSYRPIGRISVPVSPASICETPQGVVWISIDGWWIFDGSAPRIFDCDVWDSIIKNINVSATRFNAACVHYANRGEVWWFYADIQSTDGNNNRYIMWDYRSKVWSMGKLNRTCGFVYANDLNPIMSDGVSVFKHESGFTYSGSELPWIESQNLSPNGGENWLTLKRILPDVAGDADALRWRVVKTNARDGYETEVMSPQRSKNPNGYVDIRETARDMRLRIEMVKNTPWETVGPILFDSAMRGGQ